MEMRKVVDPPVLSRPVLFADRLSSRQRRREDLVNCALSVIGIVTVWFIGVFANATTQGVTEDVLRFQVIREILLLPVTFIEGLVILVSPIAIVVTLALQRRLSTIIRAFGTAIVAALAGWVIILGVSLLPEHITAPLRISTAVPGADPVSYISINLVLVTLCAFTTVSGETQNSRAVKWSWIGLWGVLFLGVLRSSMTLSGAFISVFIGRLFGSLARWFFGFEDRRATGLGIVSALLSIGVVPSRIVRTDVATDAEPLTTWTISEDEDGCLSQHLGAADASEYTLTRPPIEDGNRHYHLWDRDGHPSEVVVFDPGHEVMGTLVDVWNNVRLRGISRWISLSLKAGVERSTLTALSAAQAGVRTPETVGIAQAGESLITVTRALPPHTSLAALSADEVDDRVLDEAWAQLLAAHRHGISHRNITADSIVIDEVKNVWLVDWERGEVATTELNQRIDIAQMLVVLALRSSQERALASARRCLSERALTHAAPLLQRPVLPSRVNQEIRRSDLVANLRSELVDDPALDAHQVENIQRFHPRTLITVGILFIAVVAVLGSLNFDDIIAAVTQANPVWMAVSFALACLTWVGAAIALMALSTVKVPFFEAVIAQIAASLVTIVTPAGIGPAALNMRYLRKKNVPTALAVTTVTIQQITQLLFMIFLMITVMVVSGSSLSISLPYGTILVVVAVVIALVGTALSIPAFRKWVWVKVSPTWRQVYPRLLWVVGQPKRIAAILAGNLIMNIGFIGAFWAALKAMGGSLNFSSLTLTYLVSNSLGSVIPAPGGIGPVEATLTAGLQVAGVALSIGLPTAVLYRLVTFYGRIPFGWVAMKYLEKKNLI